MMGIKYIKKANVFEDLSFDKAELINLKVRSKLMIALRGWGHLTMSKFKPLQLSAYNAQSHRGIIVKYDCPIIWNVLFNHFSFFAATINFESKSIFIDSISKKYISIVIVRVKSVKNFKTVIDFDEDILTFICIPGDAV